MVEKQRGREVPYRATFSTNITNKIVVLTQPSSYLRCHSYLMQVAPLVKQCTMNHARDGNEIEHELMDGDVLFISVICGDPCPYGF